MFSESKMDKNSKTAAYRVKGFDSIDVKVNPKAMEIQGRKSKLEEHIRQKDLNVKKLINDGVLYPHESEFNIFCSKEVDEKINTNPWQVENIWAFSCLKCPECEFYSKEEDYFQSHAMASHPGSAVIFGKYKVI